MKRVVVDTNVPIVANGRPDASHGGRQPSPHCRLAAIDFLEETLKRRRILLDLAGEIETEYRRYLSPSGEPGVGDRFYFEVLRSGTERVERPELPRAGTDAYADFPNDAALKSFDRGDRKFAALARRERAPVANATDSDWVEHRTALAKHGIAVRFVCGCVATQWFTITAAGVARENARRSRSKRRSTKFQ
ncbi:MAG TPA: hypothetical protein VMF62_05000 [Acetobacteraceae bacterium]|nr:hypothetical protein [Acetobacteraceae bacterium]